MTSPGASLYSPGGLPAPDLDDEPNVPADLMALAVSLDPMVETRFPTTIVRDATWGPTVAPLGARCRVTGTNRQYLRWVGAADVPQWFELRDGAIVVANRAARLALPTAPMPPGFAVWQDDTATKYRWSGVTDWLPSGGLGTDAPMLIARRSNLVIPTTTFRRIPWDLVDEDTDDMLSDGGALITTKRPGYWSLSVATAYSVSGSYRCGFAVTVDPHVAVDAVPAVGTFGRLVQHGGTDTGAADSIEMPLEAGRSIRVLAYHDGASSSNLVSQPWGTTHLSMKWLRPL